MAVEQAEGPDGVAVPVLASDSCSLSGSSSLFLPDFGHVA